MVKKVSKHFIKCIIFLLLPLGGNLFPPKCLGQKNDVDFLIEKIKVDYPSFIEKTKGIDFDKFAYAIAYKNKNDTFKALSSIVDYFNDQHLQISTYKKWVHVDSLRCKKNLETITEYLTNISPLKEREGYWLNDYNNCVLAIKNVGKNPLRYKAYIIEEREGNLLSGLEMDMQQMKEGQFFTDYYSPFSGSRFFLRSVFRNDSVLITGSSGKWKKIRKYSQPILGSLTPLNDQSEGRLLDSNNYLITIPGSSVANVTKVDSIVRAHQGIISKTENLIVDIRNNLGGKSAAFEPLLQYIYTKPIARVSAYAYCSADYAQNLNEDFDSYLKGGNIDSATIKEWLAGIKMERDSAGKFILYMGDTVKFDSVKNYPKRVAVIMNYACQSAAELLILTFKQSQKVTLFGEHTMGAVDHLDFYRMDMPSGKYKFYMPTSKRYIPKGEGKLDGKGIYPQVRISDTEPDWIRFVMRYYGKN